MGYKSYEKASRFFITRVKGSSMRPFLKEGDILICERTKNIKFLDIAIFQRGNSKITHRVIYSYRDMFLLHGDNNASFFKATAVFERVNKREIIGRVLAIIRNNSCIGGFHFTILSYLFFFYAALKLIPFAILRAIKILVGFFCK